MKAVWQSFKLENRLKRRPYFFVYLGIVLFGVVGGYLLRKFLITGNSVSPLYLEATFAWGLLVLCTLTPFAVQRSHDIGISGWWVLLLWLPPFVDFRLLLILSKYTDLKINEIVFWPSIFIALAGLVFMVVLFFSPSKNAGDTLSEPLTWR